MHAASRTCWLAAWTLVLGLLLAARAPAEEAPKQEPLPPLVLRTYDVGDLLIEREDYPLEVDPLGFAGLTVTYPTPDDSGGGFGDLFGSSAAATTEPPVGSQELVDIIQRAVNNAADLKVAAWSDEGGPAALEYVDQLLIVTQTDQGHKKVEELLALLRTQRLGGPIVTIDARWVLLDDVGAAALAGDPKAPQPQEVSAAALDKAGAKVAYRGHVTCFDRQVVHLQSGRLSTYLQGAKPVVSDKAVGADPKVGAVFAGATLQVRPVLAADGAAAILDLRSNVSELKELRQRPMPEFGQVEGKAESVKLNLEMPDVIVNTLRSSVRVPLGKTVLIGGMTTHAAGEGKVLYLVLEVKATK